MASNFRMGASQRTSARRASHSPMELFLAELDNAFLKRKDDMMILGNKKGLECVCAIQSIKKEYCKGLDTDSIFSCELCDFNVHTKCAFPIEVFVVFIFYALNFL